MHSSRSYPKVELEANPPGLNKSPRQFLYAQPEWVALLATMLAKFGSTIQTVGFGFLANKTRRRRSGRAGQPRRSARSYQDSPAIADRLANPIPATPGGSATCRYRSNTIGDVQVAQGDLAGARAVTATASPSETGWRNPIRQRRLAARSLGVVREESATCRSRRATLRAR